MAKTRRPASRSYTLDEKIALVTEIERRYRAGGGALSAIAAAVGTSVTSYRNWVTAGIKPASPPAPAAPSRSRLLYEPAERERLVAEVDRLRLEGRSLEAACREAGISDKSYRKWQLDAARAVGFRVPSPASGPGSRQGWPEMRPVEITALVPMSQRAMTMASPLPTLVAEALTLVAPGGYRVEGLGIESAARLLRALS